MNYGAKLHAWREEWESSEELQFQFRYWNDYAFRNLRAAWNGSPEIQRKFTTYNDFETATRLEGQDSLNATREKASRDECREEEKRRQARGMLDPITRTVGRILGNPRDPSA